MADGIALEIQRGIPIPLPWPLPLPKPEGACGTEKCRRIPQPGYKTCDYHLVQAKRERQRKRERGLCLWAGCVDAPKEGHTLCQVHLDEMNIRNKAMREKRKAKGLCIYCNERPGWFGLFCMVCRVEQGRAAPGSLPEGAKRALKHYRRMEAIDARRRQAEEIIGFIANDRTRQVFIMRHGLNDGVDRTLEEIGRELHVTRERVRQLERIGLAALSANGYDVSLLRTPFAQVQRLPSRVRTEVSPEEKKKTRAHGLVADALKDGRLQRQPCKECGRTDAIAHHPDYDKPLEVEWLCRPHHMKAHGRGKGSKRKDKPPTPKGPRIGWWLKKVHASNELYDAASIVTTFRAHKVKQKTVSEATGVHPSALNLIVRGRQVKDEQLLAVLRFVEELKTRPVSLSI